MTIFKCKMCSGTLEFNSGDTVAVCDSCGTRQTLPKLDDDRRANLYDRANHFRRSNEYDKATGIYEQILTEVLGSRVLRLYDVGVAGVHRLLAHLEDLMQASVVIAIAGMEGALASVIGGLVDCPVIAVPTSVGYGAAFGGLAALLSMLNSCASGVSVVNIDNGFGAGFLADRINHMGVRP